MRKHFFTICIFLFGYQAYSQSDHILWYNQPAEYFEETLVLGNGKMGASVFGGTGSDKIYLNDLTLWSGEPVDPTKYQDIYKNLPAVREALKNEDYKLADKLNKKLQGKYSESYAPLGTLFIDFGNETPPTKYYRELNIENAISRVEYETNGVTYTREYFISNPDKIMAIRLSGSKKGALNFTVRFNSLLRYKVSASDNQMNIAGYAPIIARPSYVKDSNPVVFDEKKGTRFSTLVKIRNTDGSVQQTDSTLTLKGGTDAVIYISIATSFNGFDKNPVTQGLDNAAIAKTQMEAAITKPYDQLKKSHIEDYQSFFKRVSLKLGSSDAPDMPTNERLKRYAEGKEDKNLEILYFQYGRYLLISSSRTPGVPANLQGLWNPYIRPPWSSNYTTNINAEENYWLAENTNLSEMHQSMLGFIRNVAKTGEATAKNFYGVNGWTACHNSDIWAMSNPVGEGGGDPVWACWNMGGAWLSTHLWEHYLFSQDKEFLKNNYALLRGAAQFCLEWLVEDKDGELITMPSTSPENKYVTPDGYIGATFYGGTADLAMIRECMTQAVSASKILNKDSDFRKKLESAISRLHPYQIGKQGNLQEWFYDWKDQDPKHRHQSHLFGLFPGHQIAPYETPKLADACRTTLEIKGDETTGWSKGWRINLWARLGDGNRAYKMYRELLKYVDPDGVKNSTHRGGGTYPNLFDAHPPFQIDGNFGGAAAVAEMLVQSSPDEIRLLPALPDAWDSGSVSGICARGGYVLSLDWAGKSLKKIKISSNQGRTTTLICGSVQKKITVKPGKTTEIMW